MKIYFAGSIRGGRGDKELYLEIINLLKNYGEVLTEHIGNQSLTEFGEVGITDEEIYERDMAWLRSADMLVAEVTIISLGVGYEIAYAETLGKKIICLYRETEGKRLSGMLSGNKNLMIQTYKAVEELPMIFNNLLK